MKESGKELILGEKGNSGLTFYSSGLDGDARRGGGVGFLVRQSNVKVIEFKSLHDRLATLIIQRDSVSFGIVACYCQTEEDKNDTAKNLLYTKIKEAYRLLARSCSIVLIAEDFNCGLGADLCNSGPLGPEIASDRQRSSENAHRVLDLASVIMSSIHGIRDQRRNQVNKITIRYKNTIRYK